MLDKSKVLSFIKEKGPVLPRDISKQFGGDTFITGAVLSTMADAKEIKISNAKVGGSPVYYLSGQEEKLSLLYQYLPGKEKEAYTLLKEMKLIKDSTAEPAIRVALRNIKDFAKPIEVNVGESKEIFWKWYLFPNLDAEKAIREFFLPKPDQKQEIKLEEPEKEPEKRKEEGNKSDPKQPEETKDEKKEPPQKPKPDQKEPVQETLSAREEEKPKKKETGELLSRITRLFTEKGIEILETKVIKANYDIEMLIAIPSPVGNLNYFCKIRDKKKTSDKDISSLFVQSQMKKMPSLYITTGEITKKARDMIDTEFRIITIMQI